MLGCSATATERCCDGAAVATELLLRNGSSVALIPRVASLEESRAARKMMRRPALGYSSGQGWVGDVHISIFGVRGGSPAKKILGLRDYI